MRYIVVNDMRNNEKIYTVKQSLIYNTFPVIFTNWKQWVLGPTKVEKYGSSVEFMGPLP